MTRPIPGATARRAEPKGIGRPEDLLQLSVGGVAAGLQHTG